MSTFSKSALFLTLIFIIVSGCSHRTSPVEPSNSVLDSTPQILLSSSDDLLSAIGIMGIYEMNVNPDTQMIDLTPKRSAALGQSYNVSGLSFFAIAPCADCFKLKSVAWRPDGLDVTFNLAHPFEKGNTSLPITAKNRLDLDVFDIILVIRPRTGLPFNYPQHAVSVYRNVVKNPDGFTSELHSLLSDNSSLPYYLAIDDSKNSQSTFNIFEMGADADIMVEFMKLEHMSFDLYLTMGYGWSATLLTRFDPLYFNPEYNRKAAWKVEARSLGYWDENDSTTPVNVEIKVYDWQIGATVYSNPNDFENAPLDNVYAASGVERVSVEILGMNNTLQSTTTPVSGSGTPSDPLIYHIPIANQNSLPGGTYYGLVKVKDERPCLLPSDGRDILVDSTDGITMEYYAMNEYATYQIFKATVTADTGWARSWGGDGYDSGLDVQIDNDGYIYVAGGIRSLLVDFDSDPDNAVIVTTDGNEKAYLCKYDPAGNLIWVRGWGGSPYTTADSIAYDQNNRIYVAGVFSQTADFNPDPDRLEERTSNGDFDNYYSVFDTDGNYLGTQTFGGPEHEYCYSIIVDPAGNCYLGGYFFGTVDFDPSPGLAERTSNGDGDAYLAAFDSSGNFKWVQTWGGNTGTDIVVSSAYSTYSGNILAVGKYEGTVDFDTSTGNDYHQSNGQWDIFISFFTSSGSWIQTHTWGGPRQDIAVNVVCDSSGNFYISGYFWETVDFDPLSGIDNHTSVGNQDSFVSRYDSVLNYEYTYTWGGNNMDHATGLALDNADNLYVSGEFANTTNFDPTGGTNIRNVINWSDMYISKFDKFGNYIWTQTFGGLGWMSAHKVATYRNDYLYVTGWFSRSVDFHPSSFYDDIHYSKGESDAFLLKLKPDGSW